MIGMETKKSKEIEVKKIFDTLKKRLWVILLITFISTTAGAIHSYYFQPTPIYESSARIIIREDSGFMNTLKVFIKEPPVMEAVIEELQLNRSPEALSTQIQVQDVEGSQIVRIIVHDTNPENAVQIANTTASIYKAVVADTLNFTEVDSLSEAVASDNEQPINPTSNRSIKITFIMGIIVGIGYVFLLDSLDNRLRSQREIEKLLQVPVLGSVSKINKKTIVKNKNKKESPSFRGETIG